MAHRRTEMIDLVEREALLGGVLAEVQIKKHIRVLLRLRERTELLFVPSTTSDVKAFDNVKSRLRRTIRKMKEGLA